MAFYREEKTLRFDYAFLFLDARNFGSVFLFRDSGFRIQDSRFKIQDSRLVMSILNPES
jgi:hypothetical protein